MGYVLFLSKNIVKTNIAHLNVSVFNENIPFIVINYIVAFNILIFISNLINL